MPDATTVSGTDSLPESGVSPPQPRGMTDLPTGVDIPSMTTPAVISEPVGFQPEGTSVGIGSRSSLYEHVRALLADTDPDKDIFRTDLSLFTVFYNGMIEHSVAQLMATVARRDTDRAELLRSLDSGHEEVARLKEALKHAEESITIIAEDLAGVEHSRGQL
ncbi:uncharacterized protein LOC109839049 [Asparagus officinalis]|uniref:uncharacterized protein LOC109839049 n=1 Tax=Asparagus officinalis TaxID=4686 RepID=UPI00098E5F1E|nr:uncharacterized protein LOC109839049 [Asparagus officinalis]